MYKIGIDIGGTKTKIGIIDEQFRPAASQKYYNSEFSNYTKDLAKMVDKLCRENNIEKSDLISCGVGIPGTISEDGRRILKIPNFSLLGESFAEELEQELRLPVKLVQDSRAAAWGEYLCGAAKNAKSVVCVTLGTGIGTGIVLDGCIFNGALGSAGELGHLPVKENGRPCGCGKRGCLEKYCAGGGLDLTAREYYGESSTAETLFTKAKQGDEKALRALDEAVALLGSSLVSIINLLSPEYLLFSGGLSNQEEFYLFPLIEYISAHCYRTEKTTVLKKAELGENAPWIGAALIPMENKRTPLLSASIMCADILEMGKELKRIEEAGIQYLHCDIMDNHFVPNMMLPAELLNQFRRGTKLPFDFHIMAERPESIIEKLELQSEDIVSVHYESTPHLQRVLSFVRERGAKAAVAINPSTPVEAVREILDEVDMVLLMTVNPGFAGQKMVASGFEKIARMRKFLDESGFRDIKLEVDGNCSFENVPKMYKAGADIFVVGTSSVFRKDMTIKEGTKKLYKTVGVTV